MTTAPPKQDPWTPPPDYNSLVHFIRKHVQPASSVYVTRDDVLELICWVPITNTTVNLSVRMQDPDGQIIPRFETHVVAANGATPASFKLQNAEGFLLSASIETPGAPRGQAFVALRVRRGGGSADITQGEYVMAGYPGAIAGLSFPGSPVVSPLDGRGTPVLLTQGNPAAGAEAIFTVPAGVAWLVKSFRAILTTSAVASNRIVSIQARDGAGDIAFSVSAGVAQTTGTAFEYDAFAALTVFANPTQVYAAIPPDLLLPAGYSLRTSTAGLLAGDQWSALALLVEQFVGG